MSHADMLQALGYGESQAEIRRFQADFNAMGPERPIAVTGELDPRTVAALGLVYPSRALLSIVRERKES